MRIGFTFCYEYFANPFNAYYIQQFDWNLNLIEAFEIEHAPQSFLITDDNEIYISANSAMDLKFETHP